MKHATGQTQVETRSVTAVGRTIYSALLSAGLLSLVVSTSHLPHQSVSLDETGAVRAEPGRTAGYGSKILPVSHDLKVATIRALPPIVQPASDTTGEVVLSEEMQRVRDWVADSYRVSDDLLEPVLAQAEDSAREIGVDPLLIVAMVAIESSFNPRAVSRVGAQGLMQVIPRFHQDKIGEGKGKNALFDPLLNVQVGTKVLAEGLRRFGSLQNALQYYNGARKDPNARYTKKVLAMKKRLKTAALGDGA